MPWNIGELEESYPASMEMDAPGTNVADELAGNSLVAGSPSDIITLAKGILFTRYSTCIDKTFKDDGIPLPFTFML
jgi:hypothetical protein